MTSSSDNATKKTAPTYGQKPDGRLCCGAAWTLDLFLVDFFFFFGISAIYYTPFIITQVMVICQEKRARDDKSHYSFTGPTCFYILSHKQKE